MYRQEVLKTRTGSEGKGGGRGRRAVFFSLLLSKLYYYNYTSRLGVRTTTTPTQLTRILHKQLAFHAINPVFKVNFRYKPHFLNTNKTFLS